MTTEYTNIALPPGAQIAGYVIDGQIASGSFGIVYLGYRADNPGEKVAIKEFLPERLAKREPSLTVIATSDQASSTFNLAKEKFISEAAILIQLGAADATRNADSGQIAAGSRNIVKVLGYAEQNNTAYMIMEYLPGKSLKTVIDDRRDTRLKSWMAILKALLEGLSRAHRRRIWHRDIKPDNIVMRDDDTPVLIDFGAARQDIANLPATEHAFLTPLYAAPEQLTENGSIGPATDLYSLAATLYHAITGERPVGARERLDRGTAMSIDPGLATTEEERRFIESIERALNLDVERRYQSAADWLADLDADRTISTRPISPAVSATWKKPLIALGVLALAAAAGAVLINLSPTQDQPSTIADEQPDPAAGDTATTGSELETSANPNDDITAQTAETASAAQTPEPTTPSPADNHLQALDTKLQSLQCSLLQQTNDQPTYQGIIGTQDSLGELQRLAALADAKLDPVIAVESELCNALKQLHDEGPDLSYLGDDGPLQLNHDNREYRDGEFIEITVRNDSDAIRYVSIDYLDNHGQLVHITPGAEPAMSLAPGESHTFGKGNLYIAGEPYGNNVFVLYLTEQSASIHSPNPPISESVQSYIDRAERFNKKLPAIHSTARSGFITFKTNP